MQNRILELFKKKNSQILNIYYTAGFPNLDDTLKVALALEKAGVDMIEIGIPFSDPLADGPIIQQSAKRALENGMPISIISTPAFSKARATFKVSSRLGNPAV